MAMVAALIVAWTSIVPAVQADGTLTSSPNHRTQPTRFSRPVALHGPITFHGRGWGHGVGLSQYGTRGRALAGQDVATILAHYYQGTTLGSIDLATPIRVRVLSGWTASAASPLVIHGRSGPWTVDGVAATFPANAVLRLIPAVGSAVTWRLTVTSSAGAVLHDGSSTGSFRVRPAADASRLQVDSRPSSYDLYRGVLRVIAGTTAPTVSVVNELPLETYLRGVVPAEMPSTWPAVALQAQSIVARGYAARRLRPGESYYDVTDDTSSQVYLGVLGEKATTDAAITATAGQVLKSGSSIALTVFCSTAGGATEHNENSFVSATGTRVAGPLSYLRGVPDRAPDGTSYDAGSPYATWSTGTYTVAQLSAWFGADSRTNVGTLTHLDLRDRGVSGRLISVTLIGSAGTKKVSGDVFRSVFNAGRPAGSPMFRSNLFDLRPIP